MTAEGVGVGVGKEGGRDEGLWEEGEGGVEEVCFVVTDV